MTTLAALTDDELADAYDRADDDARAAILADAARRDHEQQKHRERRAAQRIQDSAWAEAMHAQLIAASEACRGKLLSRKGEAAQVSEWSLWTGPEARARAYASEELRNWWDDNGRMTVSAWREGLAESRRDEQEAAGHEQERETEKPMLGHMVERGVREAARSANRAPAQDWAVKSAELKERIDARREARANVRHAAVALREMAETQPAASQPGTVTRQAREPVDGALLLDYVRLYLERFAVWPSDAALDAAVLWIAHSHARNAKGRLVWQYSPRWLLLSSDPGSGKSWMLRIMLKLASQGKMLIEPTPAAVARSVGLQQRTIGLDEGDVLWGAGGRNAQIRAIVNTGYEPDGEWSRATKGNDTSDIPVFGPMAMAGLDKIKTATGDTLRAMLDRCIIVRVRKAPDGYRPPRFDDKARMIAQALANAQAAWCAQERDQLAAAVPEVPEGLGNRAAVLWEPLLAVADAAGGRWPDAARDACEELIATEGLPGDDLDDLGDMLAGWE